MAPWAGNKLIDIQSNICSILAIELIVAGAANSIASSKTKSGKGTIHLIDILRKHCNYEQGDRPLSLEINKIAHLIMSGDVLNKVTQSIKVE